MEWVVRGSEGRKSTNNYFQVHTMKKNRDVFVSIVTILYEVGRGRKKTGRRGGMRLGGVGQVNCVLSPTLRIICHHPSRPAPEFR